MNIKTEARKVYDKLKSTTIVDMKLGVFIAEEGDGIQITKATTDVFRKCLASRPKAFVGVYDIFAKLDDIADDIAWTLAEQ